MIRVLLQASEVQEIDEVRSVLVVAATNDGLVGELSGEQGIDRDLHGVLPWATAHFSYSPW